MTQFWVVNNSPPGTGPGGAAYTSYAIVRGTQAQAEAIPNAGGMSGPYSTLTAAYNVYKDEPQNTNVSSITTVGQGLGAGIGYAVYGDSPTQVVNTAAAVGSGLNSFSLNLGPWVLRGGEIALGIMLIAVGVAKLTGAENAVSKLPKVIPL